MQFVLRDLGIVWSEAIAQPDGNVNVWVSVYVFVAEMKISAWYKTHTHYKCYTPNTLACA